MKQKKDANPRKWKEYWKHPVGHRLMAGVLCICLMVVSLPAKIYGSLALAAEKREIVMFPELPDEVRVQEVKTGTKWEELDLPDTLAAMCRPVQQGNFKEIQRYNMEMERRWADPALSLLDGSGEVPNSNAANGTEPEGVSEATQQGEVTGSDATEGKQEESNENQENPAPSEDIENPGESSSLEEMAMIEGIAWTSIPEYDKDAKGTYIVVPILPEGYSLAEGVELPEISIIVGTDRKTEGERPDRKKKKADEKEIEELQGGQIGQLELLEAVPASVPACGVISQDTVWQGNGTLRDGELVVEPGVTLTIHGTLAIQGSVTIRGGGTVLRGSRDAKFSIGEGTELLMKNITMEGASVHAPESMITVRDGKIILDDGCKFQNFIEEFSFLKGGGSVLYLHHGTAILNNATIENCQASFYGGAIFASGGSSITINGGIYKHNKALPTGSLKQYGGGFLYNAVSKLTINGGQFIGNTSTGFGGCVYTIGYNGTEVRLNGGYFEGNTSSYPGYQGSGAFFSLSEGMHSTTETVFDLSGNVQFCGDGKKGGGTDGIYLDRGESITRKIQISNTMRYPVEVYLKASNGYVIAEGASGYVLHERDMKKIFFYDVGNSGKKWYAVLDKDKNQIYLSDQDPQYGYYVYYISNGAAGTVVDNGRYQIGDTVQVKSADGLQWAEHTFIEWNTEQDGTGDSYQPEDDLEIRGDTDLYAIFVGKKTLTANFYSGGDGKKESRYVVLDETEASGTIEAPELKELEGWLALGWSQEKTGYTAGIQPMSQITLDRNTDYYGIYQKDVTLSYVAEDAEQVPESSTLPCYANVHGQIGYDPADFMVAPAPSRSGYIFLGWNTKEDGTGTFYQPEDSLAIQEDIILYAQFVEKDKKIYTADFYSGSAGEKESCYAVLEETESSGTVIAPVPCQMEGWLVLGWNPDKTKYSAEIQPESQITLTGDVEYYGIYQKDVTLSYETEGASQSPESSTLPCFANVHGQVSYALAEFTVAPAPERFGYIFKGWNTNQDGSGDVVLAGSSLKLGHDAILYAQWEVDIQDAPYQVEHYRQDLEGDGYTKAEEDTETLSGRIGKTADAKEKSYTGFMVNRTHPLGMPSGKVAEDGSLVLKLYYDRDVYEVCFDLNGGFGAVPEPQYVRYGGLLAEPEPPKRAGYQFKGWYLQENSLYTELWDFGSPVENNTGTLKTTLYAKWADELAPVMGEASFGTGYQDFLDWVIQKNCIVITVPVLEEGSGMHQAEYVLLSEDGTEKAGLARIEGNHRMAERSLAYGSSAVLVRALQEQAEHGRYRAVITVEEEFKGKVLLSCSDNAENVSAKKTLTALGGGIIIEDNAPEIYFTHTEEKTAEPIKVGVSVEDAGDGSVTAGLAAVTYQIDGGKVHRLPKEDFQKEMVETCQFTVKVAGVGEHTLLVNAKDNAGNENTKQVSLKINEKKEDPVLKKEKEDTGKVQELTGFVLPGGTGDPGAGQGPKGIEPKTGDSTHVEIYATAAMIAGFTYLLLYFEGEHGMTEQEKEEIVYRLVEWAKRGGKLRRMLGLAVIFLFLAYYHSIGRSVAVELREVYVKK